MLSIQAFVPPVFSSLVDVLQEVLGSGVEVACVFERLGAHAALHELARLLQVVLVHCPVRQEGGTHVLMLLLLALQVLLLVLLLSLLLSMG